CWAAAHPTAVGALASPAAGGGVALPPDLTAFRERGEIPSAHACDEDLSLVVSASGAGRAIALARSECTRRRRADPPLAPKGVRRRRVPRLRQGRSLGRSLSDPTVPRAKPP